MSSNMLKLHHFKSAPKKPVYRVLQLVINKNNKKKFNPPRCDGNWRLLSEYLLQTMLILPLLVLSVNETAEEIPITWFPMHALAIIQPIPTNSKYSQHPMGFISHSISSSYNDLFRQLHSFVIKWYHTAEWVCHERKKFLFLIHQPIFPYFPTLFSLF